MPKKIDKIEETEEVIENIAPIAWVKREPIALLTAEYGRVDLNQMRDKIKEIISHL